RSAVRLGATSARIHGWRSQRAAPSLRQAQAEASQKSWGVESVAYELKVGLAGLGAAARIVLPGLEVLSQSRLTAVADIRRDEVERFAQRFEAEGFNSVEEMCAKGDVNVVYVATPNELHAEHTIMAAEYGKHVICEKPMAITMDEANRMIDAVERNGVQYVQGHSKIFRPIFRKMAEIINSGRLGRVLQI